MIFKIMWFVLAFYSAIKLTKIGLKWLKIGLRELEPPKTGKNRRIEHEDEYDYDWEDI